MKKARVTIFLFLCSLLCTTVATSKELEGKILFDFRDKSQLKKWKASQESEITWCSEGSANPGSMRLRTPAYKSKANQWPGTITVKIPQNWSEYDELQMDVFPESGICAEFPILVRSGKGNYFEKPSLDWQGQWGTVRYRINRSKLDDADIKSLTIYQSHPSAAYAFKIDNIRLVNTVHQQLTSLKNDYLAIGDKKSVNAINKVLDGIAGKRISPSSSRSQYQKLKRNIRDSSLTFLRNSFKAKYGDKRFVVASADSATRILPRAKAVIAQVASKFSVSLAQGEYEAIQVVIIAPPGQQLESVSVNVSPLMLKRKSSVTFPNNYISSSPSGM